MVAARGEDGAPPSKKPKSCRDVKDDGNNSDWDFATVDFPHTVLDGRLARRRERRSDCETNAGATAVVDLNSDGVVSVLTIERKKERTAGPRKGRWHDGAWAQSRMIHIGPYGVRSNDVCCML